MPECVPATSHILIFTKHPTSSFAKTRLSPLIGFDCAAAVSRALSDRIVATVRLLLSRSPHLSSFIHYACPSQWDAYASEKHMRAWLQPDDKASIEREELVSQKPGHLGTRLEAAFEASFAQGAARVVVVGADIPEVDSGLLGEAFARLEEEDVVIGPASDGGYYLLGMCACQRELFRDIPWSSEQVLETTINRAREEGLKVGILRELRDVDLPEDLEYFEEIISRPVL